MSMAFDIRRELAAKRKASCMENDVIVLIKDSKVKVINKNEVGAFSIQLKNHISLTNPIYVFLRFEPSSHGCLIEWKEFFNQETVVLSAQGVLEVPNDVLYCLQAKCFDLTFSEEFLSKKSLRIKVYINELAFFSPKFASQALSPSIGKNIRIVIEYFFPINHEGVCVCDDPSKDLISLKENREDIPMGELMNIEEIYERIKNTFDSSNEVVVSHKSLLPKLRPYQSQAVVWMLNCEKSKDIEDDCALHPLYYNLKLNNGINLIYHIHSGFFVTERFKPLSRVRGGILADEMGLGKTIEVISCILLNPRIEYYNPPIHIEQIQFEEPSRTYNNIFSCQCGKTIKDISTEDDVIQCILCGLLQHAHCVLQNPVVQKESYLCPYCLIFKIKTIWKIKATLIVSPATIFQQWQEEIFKHVKKNDLKIFLYLGRSHHKFIRPLDLDYYDIVLTSYEVLKKEINYLNLPYGDNLKPLRQMKKYRALPSPFLKIEWWRICLDEAQMVESVNCKAAQVGLSLLSVNRWCVTGTPLCKSFDDIYGLLTFLGDDPYHVKKWWTDLILKPFMKGNNEILISLFNRILWRTQKFRVLDQLKIPPHRSIIHEVKFSTIEKVYYDEVYFNEVSPLKSELEACSTSLTEHNQNVTLKYLKPLKNLQSMCNHFSILQDNRVNLQELSELYDLLIKKGLSECEDDNRLFIAALNGTAGLLSIQGKFDEAVLVYKRALCSIKKCRENVRTDKLQQIHILHNYSKLLEWKAEIKEVENDSRDTITSLQKECKELVSTYLSKHKTSVQESCESVNICKSLVEKAISECSLNDWALIFNGLNWDTEEQIFESLKQQVFDKVGVLTTNSIRNRCRDFSGLRFHLANDFFNLRVLRNDLAFLMKRICSPPNSEEFKDSSVCHLRKSKESILQKNICQLCQADNLFRKMESKIFCFEELITDDIPEKIEKEENICFGKLRKGTHADGEIEQIFKFIVSYFRQNGIGVHLLYKLKKIVELFDVYKKEFKALRNLWLKQSAYIAALDEIEMAKTPFLLEDTLDSVKDASTDAHMISPIQVNEKLVQFKNEANYYEENFKKKLGNLVYLKHLKDVYEINGTFEETCPICYCKLQDYWVVLSCGHKLCNSCSLKLRTFSEKVGDYVTKCPYCCEQFATDKIFYVETQKIEENSTFQIKGHFGSKVNSVVQCLLEIQESDPLAKILVFSNLPEFFRVLEIALLRNDVTFIHASKKKELPEKVKNFKESATINILLLPLTLGNDGLNLIEASHVLLVEPFLNMAEKLQAIGRVHRIGQTKETKIHEFYIKDTVEERLFKTSEIDLIKCHYKKLLNLEDIYKIYFPEL